MDDISTTTAKLDETDEEILTDTACDEALEAAAGTERGDPLSLFSLCGATCKPRPAKKAQFPLAH